mmetsp:Transcript_6012/g.9096  ORF Transcript_6012/g.9096 Transcript_6012/m.9096 type:complete len:291 (-) Transcript_6012:429-1301(-)
MATLTACAAVTSTSSISSTPLMRPHPRTSLIRPGSSFCRALSPARSCSPRASAFLTRPSSMTAFTVARAAAQARGLPPNVLAWSPGWNTLQKSLQSMAPMGTPPPRALAQVNTSGSTPRFSYPHILPVRPTPTCTSSIINRAPVSSQISRAAFMNSTVLGRMPPSPCRASIMIPATFLPSLAPSSLIFFTRERKPSASLYVAYSKPGGRGPKFCWYLGCPVAVMAARVRPWKESRAVMITGDFTPFSVAAYFRHNLIAASLASAPELQKKALSAHEFFTSSSARSACSGI